MTFTRDGHLLDLALQRHLVQPEEEIAEHLAGCERCQARFATAEAEHAEPLPELDFGSPHAFDDTPFEEHREAEVIPFPAARVVGVAVAVMAMAAAVVFALRTPTTPVPDKEEFTIRGTGVTLEVHRQDGDGSQQLAGGDPVQKGDTLGFRVAATQDGYLLVGGRDGAGTTYPVYPRGAAPQADPFAKGPLQQLEVGLSLDATPGQERLVAVHCTTPLAWGTFKAHMDEGAPLPKDCAVDEVVLEKK